MLFGNPQSARRRQGRCPRAREKTMSDQDPKSQRILKIFLIPTTIGLAVLRALKEVLVTQETPASVQDPIDEIEAMFAEPS